MAWWEALIFLQMRLRSSILSEDLIDHRPTKQFNKFGCFLLFFSCNLSSVSAPFDKLTLFWLKMATLC
ncbi:hypothetical protein HanXRQr2_Chr15g0680151 [Helianthus annuus]|uniref:Uncharacterized protein n=1 Tax=Helianthus annuus TaxID=4232 RepID=A0A9K3H1A4_HELAN|nr:hypothetical protein HanXRQr2_Chr15g0680151 [Helianthus annuus]